MREALPVTDRVVVPGDFTEVPPVPPVTPDDLKGEDGAAIDAQALPDPRSASVGRRGGFVMLRVGGHHFSFRKVDARRLGAMLQKAGM